MFDPRSGALAPRATRRAHLPTDRPAPGREPKALTAAAWMAPGPHCSRTPEWGPPRAPRRTLRPRTAGGGTPHPQPSVPTGSACRHG